MVKDPAKWDQYSSRLLYATLVQAGSVGFIPYELPIVQETPTMVVGVKVETQVFSLVASMNKEMSSYFAECLAFETRHEFLKAYTSTFHEALLTFKQQQRLVPRRIVVYYQVDSINEEKNQLLAELALT